jgi:hypothetical protein
MSSQTDKVLLFEYGSNMVHSRLTERLENVEVIGVGRLPNWRFTFSKTAGLKENGGNGKCQIEKGETGDCVYGVIYRLTVEDLQNLNSFNELTREYFEDPITVIMTNPDGSIDTVDVITYSTEEFTDPFHPAVDYEDAILRGAKQNHLPQAYVDQIISEGGI